MGAMARSMACPVRGLAHDVCLPVAYHDGYHWVAKIFGSLPVEIFNS